MSRHFANEADFHQRIIENPDSFPDMFRGAPSASTLFWAHELTLHDAGRSGGNGSADLLTVDDTGRVWLIEVKFNFSFEAGAQIWHNQLSRYRRALMRMGWREIVGYTHQFLTGFEKTKPQLSFRSNALSLEECITDWLAASKLDAAKSGSIVAKMAESLQSGNFGIMLVSNYFNETYRSEAAAFANSEHTGPVAYAVIEPDTNGFTWIEKYFRPAINQSAVTAPYISSDFQSDKMPLVTPARLRTLVSPACCNLLDTIVYPRLETLGWDERHAPKRSAFDAIIPIGQEFVRLLVVGTSELDAKALERHAKIEGDKP